MEHTEGKWTITGEDVRGNDIFYRVEAKNYGLIALVDATPESDELKANARRICQCVNSHDALLAVCEDVRVELALLHRIIVDPPEFAKDPAVKKPLVDKIEKRQKQVKDAIAAAQIEPD